MSQLRSIIDFRSALQGGGARPNLFMVEMDALPSGIFDDQTRNAWTSSDNGLKKTFKFTCKAAALPASNIASIDVPVRGKTLKIPGDRTFDPWTVTIMNTEDFRIRKIFEQWIEYIAYQNQGYAKSTNPSEYQTIATVKQLARDADQGTSSYANKYQFEGIYPSNISAIDMSYDSTDTISEFTVEFQVQYWVPA